MLNKVMEMNKKLIGRREKNARDVIIRRYEDKDFPQLAEIYRSSFAEPPWNECWLPNEIAKDLAFAQSQPDSIILVAAGKDGGIKGFTWGYELTGALVNREFPFLERRLEPNGKTGYMDEIAVGSNARRQGIGSALCAEYLRTAEESQVAVVTRTDVRNWASMRLFESMGFEKMGIFDPRLTLSNRLYLKKSLRSD
jgi:ribosomal protein S18 acetylase RimI-like enzyme